MTPYSTDGPTASSRLVAVAGATGYIGTRLVPRLVKAGWRVRCLVRSPRKLADRPWYTDERVEIVRSDLSDTAALSAQLDGCDAAFYLVHSMLSAGPSYAKQDKDMARRFAEASATAGVGRIIYLGGLGETGQNLSEHLTSRREVEKALASAGVPLTVFRAAMIIGSGSASFEILRYLAERSGAPVRRDELLAEIWGVHDGSTTRAVDFAVARLRKKIERDPHAPRYLKTAHGDGYSLTFEDPLAS
jgi:uncharacterized protein YbjT (DUF2867 family)